MIVMRKPKETTEDPVVEHAEKKSSVENEVAAAEAVAREAQMLMNRMRLRRLRRLWKSGSSALCFPVDIQPSDISRPAQNAGSDYGFR